MNRLLRFLLVSVMALFLAGSVTSSAAAKEFKKTALFNLTFTPQVIPNRVFFTANSGPYLKKLKWKNWGEAKTVARGRFISDCASCGPYETKATKLPLW